VSESSSYLMNLKLTLQCLFYTFKLYDSGILSEEQFKRLDTILTLTLNSLIGETKNAKASNKM
jgi:hypothetical protein